MKLTALEIKQQQFEKSLRGYDTAEVRSFLKLISGEWESMTARIKELEYLLDKMRDRLKHYERVEQALHETLQTAKSSAEEKLSNARKESEIIREKAEMEAENLIRDAHTERREIRQNIIQLIDKRNEMIRTIESYLDNTKQSLDQFSKNDRSLFTMPKQESGKTTRDKQSKSRESETPDSDQYVGEAGVPGADQIERIVDEID